MNGFDNSRVLSENNNDNLMDILEILSNCKDLNKQRSELINPASIFEWTKIIKRVCVYNYEIAINVKKVQFDEINCTPKIYTQNQLLSAIENIDN